MKQLFAITALMTIVGIVAGDRANVNITMEGNCPPMFMQLHRGIQPTKFIPRISFNDAKVSFDPSNPTIPGCMTVKIKNVLIRDDPRFRNALLDISAEYDLRIGGTPGPESTKLACGRTAQQDNCNCGSSSNNCMVCGFCKNMQRVGNQVSFFQNKKYGALDIDASAGRCDCQDPFVPGTYELQTEICTPNKTEIEKSIPNQLLELMGENKKVSMWTAIYLYDSFRPDAVPANRALRFMTRPDGTTVDLDKNAKTIGCFMLGYNVNVEA